MPLKVQPSSEDWPQGGEDGSVGMNACFTSMRICVWIPSAHTLKTGHSCACCNPGIGHWRQILQSPWSGSLTEILSFRFNEMLPLPQGIKVERDGGRHWASSGLCMPMCRHMNWHTLGIHLLKSFVEHSPVSG